MSIGDYSGGRAGIFTMHELSVARIHQTIYSLVAVGLDIGCQTAPELIGSCRAVYHFLSLASQG